MPKANLLEGDIVLLTTAKDDPISTAVAEIDRSRYPHPGSGKPSINYSHCGFVTHRNGEWLLVSAATANNDTKRPSGVSELRLKPLHRDLLVLRSRGGGHADALTKANEWIEWSDTDGREPTDDPSNFGVVEVVLSSLAAAARNLKPGSLGRSKLWAFAHWASRRITPPGLPTPGGPRERWDCSAFVDAAFRAVGQPLEIKEGDPDPREPREVWKAYLALARGLLTEKLCKDDEHRGYGLVFDEYVTDEELDEALGQAEGIADASWISPGDIRKVLKLIVCAIGWPTDVASQWNPAEAEIVQVDDNLVWPPFMSLRLMFEQLDVICTIPWADL